MYPRNAVSPPRIAVGAIYVIATGAKVVADAAVVVRVEGGAEGAGGGTLAVGATSGIWYYTPTQAETNYTAFTVTVYKADCTTATVTVITTATAVSGTVNVGSIATDAITDDAIATGAIASTAFAAGAITNAAVADDVDVNVKTISANAITATAIQDGAITNAKVADDVDVNVKTITNGAITAAAIATGAIDADALAADAITAINDDVIDTIDNNSGYDRLAVYGDDKLFDLASGEGWATWPSVVYDSDAANWRCYYNALFDSKRCIRMRTSTDGKTNWSDPTTVLLPADVGTTYLVTSVVWRESAGDWRMLYTAFAVNSNIHYATSTDGLTWTDYGSNPVISADQDWDVGTAGRHFIEVTGVMKVGTTYYIYFGSINTGEQRKTGVAWTTDFVTFTRQTDPVFGDSGMSNVQEPYSGYFSGTPFTSAITGGIYYLLVTPYEHGTQYARMEMWASSSPLFPASNRRLVKTILTCGHGTVFPNRKLDAISIATDNVSQNTFTAASNEIRIYFGAEHSSGDDGTKVWYTALATATNIYDLLKPIDVSREITRGRLPQQRGQLTQSNMDATLADTNEVQAELADGGRTDLLIDGIAAKTDLIPASPAAVGSAMTVSDKTGFSLAATGLNALSIVPVANPTTWPERMTWFMQRFFRSRKTPTEFITETDDGETLTTQTVTDDGAGTESLGAPS